MIELRDLPGGRESVPVSRNPPQPSGLLCPPKSRAPFPGLALAEVKPVAAPPQKVRRSHEGDLISVWKGDRSEPTTLRELAGRGSTPSTTPGLHPLTPLEASCHPVTVPS